MKGAIETMVGVVLIAFMAVLSTAYISASLNTQKAQAYHSTVVTEIEASDYNAEVLEKYAFGASDHRICKIEKRGKESMPGTDETCSDGIFYFNYADFCRSIDLYGGDKNDASE